MSCNVEVGSAVFEEVEGLEVEGALVESFCVLFALFMEWGEIVGEQTIFYIFSRAEIIVFCMELGDDGVGVGFGEHALEFIV